MGTSGWSTGLPRIPGYYWVRLPGYERSPTIAEIELQYREALRLACGPPGAPAHRLSHGGPTAEKELGVPGLAAGFY